MAWKRLGIRAKSMDCGRGKERGGAFFGNFCFTSRNSFFVYTALWEAIGGLVKSDLNGKEKRDGILDLQAGDVLQLYLLFC